MDRYWPYRFQYEAAAISDWTNCHYVAYDYDDHFKEINVPLISFQSGLYAAVSKINITNGIANADFTSIVLPIYGKVDIYSGINTATDVSEPAYQWMLNHLPITLFGNTAIGTVYDQNDANAQSVSYFTCTKSGLVTDIMAYIDGASAGNCVAALYAANGNSPGALIAQSNPVKISTAFSWVDFQLPTPYTVIAGTTYGLAVMGDVPVNPLIVPGSGQRTGGPGYGSYARGFTNPFGTTWFNDPTGAMSIYAANSNQLIGTEFVYSESGNVVLNLPAGGVCNKTNIKITYMKVDEKSTRGAQDILEIRVWVPSRNSFAGIATLNDNPAAAASRKLLYAGMSAITIVQLAPTDLEIWKQGNSIVVNLTKPINIMWGDPAPQVYKDLNFTLPTMTLKFVQTGEVFDEISTFSTYPSKWNSTITTSTAPDGQKY